MNESIKLFLTKFSGEALTIVFALLVIVIALFIVYWIYNRRRIHQLTHQIPAGVLKNYLDSIIQNSMSLKSSLFRGGGLDIEGGAPSIVPAGSLPTGGGSDDECQNKLNQKIAEISTLQASLTDKDGVIRSLEAKIATLETSEGSGESIDPNPELEKQLQESKDKISDLEKQLADALANQGGAGDGDNERIKELEAQLEEYELIADDIADLKRLRQENEQLKKALEAGGGAVPEPESEAAAETEPTPEPEPEPEAVAEPDPTPEPEPESEAVAESEPTSEPEPEVAAEEEDLEAAMAAAIAETPPTEDDGEAAMAAAIAESGNDENTDLDIPTMEEGEQKSSEELLSEFEKMLEG